MLGLDHVDEIDKVLRGQDTGRDRLVTDSWQRCVESYGMDPSRQFYQVLLDAAYIWVRVDTIGPTNDEVWAGTPLPNVIIQP